MIYNEVFYFEMNYCSYYCIVLKYQRSDVSNLNFSQSNFEVTYCEFQKNYLTFQKEPLLLTDSHAHGPHIHLSPVRFILT